MQISDRILDDLLRKVFRRLLASKHQITASRGTTRELIGVLLKLERPRARLSRSETRGRAFSCLGEFLWYLSGTINSNSFVTTLRITRRNQTTEGPYTAGMAHAFFASAA